MARDDRWDDEDVDDVYDEPRRRRRRAWEDDDYEIERYQITRSSGAVIGAGVFSIVWGSLVFLGGGCIMIAALASPDAFGVRVQVRDFVAVVVAIFALLALWGLCAIIAAIGVLTRGNWGRIFTFVLGGFAILFGILFLLGSIPQRDPGGIIVGLLIAVMFFLYTTLNYVILLNSSLTRGFR